MMFAKPDGKQVEINVIKALSNTKSSAGPLKRGAEYKVPSDVSLEDARVLVRLGKAEIVEKAKPSQTPEEAEAAAAEKKKKAEAAAAEKKKKADEKAAKKKAGAK